MTNGSGIMTPRRILWGIALALLAGAAAYSLRPTPIAVSVAAPERRTVQEFIAEEAKTRLGRDILIDMPFAGRVEGIARLPGEHLEAGETLTRVDTYGLEQQLAGLEARVAQARAQIRGVDAGKPKPEDLEAARKHALEAAESLRIAERARDIAAAQADEAEREAERIAALREAGIASTRDLEAAETLRTARRKEAERAALAVQAAALGRDVAELNARRVEISADDNEYLRDVYQAEIEQLRAQINVLRDDLERANVRAPVSGPLLERFVEHPRALPAGAPLARVGDLDSIEIECDVLSEEVVRVAPGNPVEITGRAVDGAALPGAVTRVYPAAFQKISSLGIEQQRVRTIVGFDNTGLGLRPGTSVDVRIITAEAPDVLAIPERALFREDGSWRVFVVRNGRAEAVTVEVGLRNDTWAEIRGGLAEDSEVITELGNEIAPGVRVRAAG